MSFAPKNFNIWFEIPVPDMEAGVAFYSALTGADLTVDDSGPNPIAMFPIEDMQAGSSGHLYPGKPAADGRGVTVHLAAEKPIEDMVERAENLGASNISPIIAIDPGRFFYCDDPFGNSIALFELRS